MYKIIQFETKPIRIVERKSSIFPADKYWNKLHMICKTYAQTKNLPGDRELNIDDSIFLKEMNTPTILRNCGLNNFGKILKGKEFLETDYIKPVGEKNGKKIYPQYIKISKKYILIESEKIDNLEKLKIAKLSRLTALMNNKPVQIYDIEIKNSVLKIIETTRDKNSLQNL